MNSAMPVVPFRIMNKALPFAALIVAAILILLATESSGQHAAEVEPENEASGNAESETSEPEAEKKKGGVSLGKILGLIFLACCIIYCIGISWKVYKVCKGTYVEEEPVFLKYK